MQSQKIFVLVGFPLNGKEPMQSLVASFSYERLCELQIDYQNTHDSFYIEEVFVV